MQVFAVVVNRDDTVKVVAEDVVKVTPAFYFIANRSRDDVPWQERHAFGYSQRLDKSCAHVTAQSALSAYMARRQRDKENARAVVAQATKQIAAANEALQALPPAVDAVDPVAAN